MCGIFGYFGYEPESNKDLFEVSSRLLRHRGPDDYGCEFGEGWGVGFRRLSILDLSQLGHQPMCTSDQRYWLVFNGEIYNFIELRSRLENSGEVFVSTSDTEVLLRLLVIEGPKALEKLNGMFSLVFIDTKKRRFLMARDRLGQKPIYYFQLQGQLRFASELKGLLAWHGASKELDYYAVAQYLAIDYLPNSTSIFRGYKKLPQGCYLTGSLDEPEKSELRRYWQLEINTEEGETVLSDEDIDELHSLLSDATNIRLRSDVPVGIFLSGGIDSGLVAAFSSNSAEGSKLRALTVSFSDKDYDEKYLARATAEYLNMEQDIIDQAPIGLQDVDRISWYFDEPFGDPSAIPTFNLCEVASNFAKVFLAGDGGDESFGGYDKYRTTMTRNYKISHMLSPMIGSSINSLSKMFSKYSSLRYRIARKSLPPGGYPAARGRVPFDPIFLSVVSGEVKQYAKQVGNPFWDSWEKSQGSSVIAGLQEIDFSFYLPDDVLVKVDRASMAHSIELRSPFLDYRVVEWAARLPRTVLLNSNQGKLPLRKLASSLLPKEVQRGIKRGFGVPVGSWMRQPAGQAFVRERLLSDKARKRGLWDLRSVERMIDIQQGGGGRDFGDWLWRLLVLDSWARNYLDSDDFLQGPPRATRE